MIKIENIEVYGWEAAIRGMRNPMNSWEKSDSKICPGNNCEGCDFWRADRSICSGNHLSGELIIGPKDLKLMQTLVKSGTDHSKFMRMINVTMDITAPMYWAKEMDTYKVGTVRNSCSTMHKIHNKEFTLDDFSCEHLFYDIEDTLKECYNYSAVLTHTLTALNSAREHYLKTKDKKYWWQMIQLLPSSYNQKFTWQANYQVLRNIYFSRRNHKLDEWHYFCNMIESLPYGKELICSKGG